MCTRACEVGMNSTEVGRGVIEISSNRKVSNARDLIHAGERRAITPCTLDYEPKKGKQGRRKGRSSGDRKAGGDDGRDLFSISTLDTKGDPERSRPPAAMMCRRMWKMM